MCSGTWRKTPTDGEDRASGTREDDSLEPYADEPLADEEWLKNYRREQGDKRQLEED